jgi:hypothetical protein
MNFKNFKLSNKGLYWGLIATFAVLYFCVGFVSTLHSITFFHLANTMGLAILLGLTYEVGQASVLFSILMTKGKEKFLPWALMILLTALQVSANVYASFKFMATSGSNDWQYWQKAILFGVQASSPEMYQVIISWIAGALLPVVALGMTALVAQNIKLMASGDDEVKVDLSDETPAIPVEEIIQNEVNRRLEEALKEKEGVEPPELEPIKEQEPEPIKDESEPEIIPEPRKEIIIEDLLPSREDQLTGLKNAIVNNIQQKASPNEENPLIGEGGVQIVRPPVVINIGPENQEEANAEYAKSLDPEVRIGEGGIQVLKDAHSYDAKGNPLEVVEVIRERPKPAEPTDEELEEEAKQYEDQLDEEASQYMDIHDASVNLNDALKNGQISLLPIMEDLQKKYESNNIPIEDKKALINALEAIKQPATTIYTNPPADAIPDEVAKETIIPNANIISLENIKPVNKVQGWHFMKEYVDEAGNIFEKGKYVGNVKNDPQRLKKA